MTSGEEVVMAMPLSLQTKITGSDQAEARLIDSISMPWFIAPSPKNATATLPGRRCWAANANPQAAGPEAPTMPDEAARCSGENRCMCPPMPRHKPSSRPMNSLMSNPRSTPRITSGAVPRCSSAMASPSVRWSTTPATIASSPLLRCISAEMQPSSQSRDNGFLEAPALVHLTVECFRIRLHTCLLQECRC